MSPPASPSPSPAEGPNLEDLLAEALAAFDEGGEAALKAFVGAHPREATQLERGIARCKEMGLLARTSAASDHPERLGEFRLLRRIGGGGMGVVYEAVQEQLGRRVALKIIRPELLFFEGARERFRREVDAIAQLEHPAIVPVLATGEHDGVPYFAMELMSGVSLEQICTALRGRDPAQLTGADLKALMPAPVDSSDGLFAEPWWRLAVRLAHQVALGLRHAHLRGIVHRDVKPSNVIVNLHGQAIVLDFGVAQVRKARELTRSGATPGSPAFMSPEQMRGLTTDERTDVYSLAATLWNLLTLRRPFDEGDLSRIQIGDLPPLRRFNRDLPSELELVLRTAMDRDRERRYPDMESLAADFEAVLARRPIEARPLGIGLRLVRWCQRHRVTATALVATLLGAAVLPAALYFQQQAATEALRVEERRTSESLETTLEALHAILVRLGNRQLRDLPLAEKIAHGALGDAVDLYRKLLERHPNHEKVRVQAGRALHTLAMSFERHGDTKEAIATLEEAIAVLGSAGPGSHSLLDIRGHAQMGLASYLADTPDKAGAFAALDAAERDLLATASSPYLRAESLRARASLRTTRSLLLDESKGPAACEAALREAVALMRACIATGDSDTKNPGFLVNHLANLAKFLHRQGRLAEARTVFEEALANAQQLPSSSAWPPPQVKVAELLDGIGNLLSAQKDPQAETFLRESIDGFEKALAQFPNNVAFRMQLGGTIHNFATYLFRDRGRTEDALRSFERARELQAEVLAKTPTSVQSLDFMGKHLTMIGYCQVRLLRGEDLAATAKALAELPTKSHVVAIRSAEFTLQSWRLRGRSDTKALDLALERVLLAEERGLDTSKDLAFNLYDPLRKFPAFRELEKRLAARGTASRPASSK